MSDIEWTDKTWNPVVGCSRVSDGCTNCYAERFVHRGMAPQHRGLTVLGKGEKGPRWTGEVRLVESALAKPLSWRKPQRVFVNSLSDLFHEKLGGEDIARVFAVMAQARQHTFQVLTKRPARMREMLTDGAFWSEVMRLSFPDEKMPRRDFLGDGPRMLPNVWLGVTAEDQQRADERIPLLLDTPAAVRFVSYEPALGPVRFDRWLPSPRAKERHTLASLRGDRDLMHAMEEGYRVGKPCVDWLIVGGESGPKARPMHDAWARAAVHACRTNGVPVFYKQGGASNTCAHSSKGACLDCAPAELRVREFPGAAS